MPDDFDIRLRKYRTESGRVRTRAEVRGYIDQLTTHVKKQAKSLAEKYGAGKLSPAEFQEAMRELLKSGHIIAASVGKGGRARMTQADWITVGEKIAWQDKYLKRFAGKIAKDILSGPASSNRVQLYADALHVTFYKSFYSTMTESPSDAPKGKDGKELLVKLVQNSAEGCEDCEADANEGYMRLDEMGELGNRICGDFCKCDLIFSDDESTDATN